MQPIELYYLSPNPYGGWMTFTAHLFRALQAAGLQPIIHKVRLPNPKAKKVQVSENKQRDFGYGLRYRNVTLRDALRSKRPKLIVAAAKKYQDQAAALLDAGAYLVLHDPTELKNLPPVPGDRTIVIRQASVPLAPGATFIRHPYVRNCAKGDKPKPTVHAVSTARIDFDKHTHMLLDANRLLPADQQVQLHGFENRLYGRFKLMPKYPEWAEMQSKFTFERKSRAATSFLLDARYAVDMSEIKGDGGGTQYTFLEAWDAGAVLVINQAWVRDFPDGDMQPKVNCLAVADGAQLAKLLAKGGNRPKLVDLGYKQLELHDPELIGNQYRKALGL